MLKARSHSSPLSNSKHQAVSTASVEQENKQCKNGSSSKGAPIPIFLLCDLET